MIFFKFVKIEETKIIQIILSSSFVNPEKGVTSNTKIPKVIHTTRLYLIDVL
jgi:hypothetical protein